LVDELLLAMVTAPQVRGGGGQGEQRRPEIEEVGMAAGNTVGWRGSERRLSMPHRLSHGRTTGEGAGGP
jgi:hypothetical protein